MDNFTDLTQIILRYFLYIIEITGSQELNQNVNKEEENTAEKNTNKKSDDNGEQVCFN